jgi:hypothetical protein
MLKDIHPHIGDVVGIRLKNNLYFFKLRLVGKHDRKNIGKPLKNPFFLQGNESHQKGHNECHKY